MKQNNKLNPDNYPTLKETKKDINVNKIPNENKASAIDFNELRKAAQDIIDFVNNNAEKIIANESSIEKNLEKLVFQDGAIAELSNKIVEIGVKSNVKDRNTLEYNFDNDKEQIKTLFAEVKKNRDFLYSTLLANKISAIADTDQETKRVSISPVMVNETGEVYCEIEFIDDKLPTGFVKIYRDKILNAKGETMGGLIVDNDMVKNLNADGRFVNLNTKKGLDTYKFISFLGTLKNATLNNFTSFNVFIPFTNIESTSFLQIVKFQNNDKIYQVEISKGNNTNISLQLIETDGTSIEILASTIKGYY